MSAIQETKDNDSDIDKSENPADSTDIPSQVLLLESNLCDSLRKITFTAPVQYVYNPLEYAFDVHTNYVKKYCTSTKEILFLGMNPGPWGMSQTGVPFGEIQIVKNWLKLSGEIGKPPKEHPDRKIVGFDCTRSEVSGFRFWGLFKKLCGTPEKLFEHTFVRNYCPIALMNSTGKNITPAQLQGAQKAKKKVLEDECDKALIQLIKILNIKIVIGIGRYAEEKAREAITQARLNVKVLYLKHPSPQVVGNQNWDKDAEKALKEMELMNYFTD